MKQAHKQRLVGGVVLFALGLIFIPMVLDFSRDDHSRVENAEIPQSPDTMKMEVLPLDVWSQKVDPEVNRDSRVVETFQIDKEEREAVNATADSGSSSPGDSKAEDHATVNKTKSEDGKSSESVAESKPKPAVEKAEAPAPVSKPAPKPALQPAPGSATAWVIQVASLTKENKAYGLRDQLRKAGHPAFVEQVKGSSGMIYRVKSGPVLQRSKAESMKSEIKKLTKLDGLIMRHR